MKVPENWYGNWHHVAGIYDGEKMVLYIDDKVVGEEKFSGNISNTPFPVCIGRDANTQDQGEYSGRMSKMVIDDVRIFDKAVSLSELKSVLQGQCLHSISRTTAGRDFLLSDWAAGPMASSGLTVKFNLRFTR
jgi:beta-galactosidase